MAEVRHRRERAAGMGERVGRLTTRETEILQYLATGHTPAEIAERLEISPHTLRTHVQNILTKLGVHSKLQALAAAIRYGKVEIPKVEG